MTGFYKLATVSVPPRSISFEPALPRTDAGKLYKQELVKKYSRPNLD
jgi:acyl-CoA synthetase (AMP-forming)/AMP-acid ligase II